MYKGRKETWDMGFDDSSQFSVTQSLFFNKYTS